MFGRTRVVPRFRSRRGSRRQPAVERLEQRQLLTNGLSEYAITTSASQPLSAVQGPDGNFWFTEYTAGKIGKMSPAGTVLAEYSLNGRRDPGSHHPYGITTGPDGNLWFTDPVIVNGSVVTRRSASITPSGASRNTR